MLDKPNSKHILAKFIEENKNEIFTLGSAMAKPNWMNGSCKINIISLAHFQCSAMLAPMGVMHQVAQEISKFLWQGVKQTPRNFTW
jgi:hypothetical protein